MPFNVTMPKLSPTMEEGIISKWHKKEGEFVEAGELLMEVATDKATVEYNAIDEGFLRKIVANEGQNVKVNDLIAIFTETKDETFDTPLQAPDSSPGQDKPSAAPSAPQNTSEKVESINSPSERLLASPLAKKIAKDKGIDLQNVEGSGPRGRIVSRDLQNTKLENESQKSSKSSLFSPRPSEAANKMAKSSASQSGSYIPGSHEKIPLTPIRKIIAERLSESKSTIPHFYVKQTINASALVEIRDQLKTFDIKVSFNDFVIRAVALALKQHPEVNAGFDGSSTSILKYNSIDIAVAVSIPGGLITPIIANADHKSVQEISSEMKSLADKARLGKLQEQEYKGGSFSISNMGMFGIEEFSAIINPPQAAILAVGGIREEPIVKSGSIVVGKVMTCVLSIDHRVVDGAKAAEFLKSIQQLLEAPGLLLI